MGYKLERIEAEKGDLHKLIPPMVNEVGQAQTGRRLGVAAATINTWLKDNGYVKVVKYERKGEMSK